jgi:O-antigen biosynthesis protein
MSAAAGRSRPGTICFVTADFAGVVRNGGIGTHFLLMSRLLAQRDWKVHVLFCGAVDDAEQLHAAPQLLASQGIEFHQLENLPASPGVEALHYGGDHPTLVLSEHVLAALEHLHSAHRFDLVEFPDWGALGLRPIQAKAAGDALTDVSLAVKLHSTSQWQREGNLQLRSSPRDLKMEFCERYAFERADVQLSPSHYMLDYARGVEWAVREDARVAYPYPDPEPEPTAQAAEIRELVFFGRLERRKGLHLFLDALDDVAPEMPVLFMGKDTLIDGVPASELIAERLGDRPHRIEPGLDRSGALERLRRGDRLAVIPSLSETFGFTVAECVANRVPFVAARAGGIPEVVLHPDARDRWLFEPTVEGLREALARRLNGSGDEEIELRAEAAAGCDSTLWNDRVESVYREVARRPPARVERVAEPSTVTVAIPHFNHERFLPAALASLAAQSRAADEVVVIDDGSTSPRAREVFGEMERAYPDWTFLRQENAGPGVARNRSLEDASGTYFLPFDSDNIATPDLIERLVTAMDRNPSRAATTCHNLAFVDDADIEKGDFAFRYAPTGGPKLSGCLENVYGDTCALFRTDALRSVGGFEVHPWSPHEDWETFVKMTARGLEVEVLPQPLFYYRVEAGGRLQTLAADPGVIHRQRALMIDHFFADGELTARERRDLWEMLLAFDHVSFGGRSEQQIWHESEMTQLREWSDERLEELRAHLLEQVEGQRARAEALEQEMAQLRTWSDERLEDLRAHLLEQVEGQRARAEALEHATAPGGAIGPPSAGGRPRLRSVKRLAPPSARRLAARYLRRPRTAVRILRAAVKHRGGPPLRTVVRRLLARHGIRLDRFPQPLLRHPEGELRMQFDFALAQRVALSDDFYFVQIGAFDGRTDDPLFGWVQAYRWRGLLVEPQTRYFSELRENYDGVDGLEFRRAAVGTRRETRTLFTVADEPGVPHWAGLLASFERDVLLSHRRFLPAIDDLIREEPVECIPINELLEEAESDHVDLLLIDVEGYDHELVRALDIERFSPSIIRFEHVHLSQDQHDACLDRLIAHGYKVCLEQNDTLAYRPDHLSPHSPEGVSEGPAQLQAEHERQTAAAHEAHLAHVAELERRLAAAEAHTKRVEQEAAAFRQLSLEKQEAFLTAALREAVERAESAERRLQEREDG